MRAAAVEGSEVSLDAALRVLSRSTDANAKRCAAAATKAKTKDPRRVARVPRALDWCACVPGASPRVRTWVRTAGNCTPGGAGSRRRLRRRHVRRDVRRDDEVPVFYNAVVEREPTDPRGYDALFIDGMVKGSILTRASHSCDPNAAMRVRVRDGKYAVEMWTVRASRVGRDLLGLPVSHGQRGGDATRAMLLRRQGVSRQLPPLPKRSSLRRARQEARIARAFLCAICSSGVSRRRRRRSRRRRREDPRERGVQRGARDAPGILAGLPRWLVRFAATCASSTRRRKKSRSRRDCSTTRRRRRSERKRRPTTRRRSPVRTRARMRSWIYPVSARRRREAESVAAGRLQSLAVTLDKTRRVLAESASSGSRSGSGSGSADASVSVENAPPPLAVLTDAEATTHLDAVRVESLNARARGCGSRRGRRRRRRRRRRRDARGRARRARRDRVRAVARGGTNSTSLERRVLHGSGRRRGGVGVRGCVASPRWRRRFFARRRARRSPRRTSRWVPSAAAPGWFDARSTARSPRYRFSRRGRTSTRRTRRIRSSARRARGRLPDPAGPLRAAAEPASRGRKPPPARGAIADPCGHLLRAFALAAMGAGGSANRGETCRDRRGVVVRDAARKRRSDRRRSTRCWRGTTPRARTRRALAAARARSRGGAENRRGRRVGRVRIRPQTAGRKVGRRRRRRRERRRRRRPRRTRARTRTRTRTPTRTRTLRRRLPPRTLLRRSTRRPRRRFFRRRIRRRRGAARPISAKLSRSAAPPVPPYGAAFDHGVRCSACGELGEDGTFLLCRDVPGANLDCLGMDRRRSSALSRLRRSVLHRRLAGITPPGRARFEAAAVRAVAAGRIGGGGGKF